MKASAGDKLILQAVSSKPHTVFAKTGPLTGSRSELHVPDTRQRRMCHDWLNERPCSSFAFLKTALLNIHSIDKPCRRSVLALLL